MIVFTKNVHLVLQLLWSTQPAYYTTIKGTNFGKIFELMYIGFWGGVLPLKIPECRALVHTSFMLPNVF